MEICTRLLSFTHTTRLMEGVMTGAVSGDLKAIVWIEFRYFDLAGKCPSDHPEELIALFGEITLPGNIQTGFDARIRQIFRLTLKKRPERCR